MEQSGLRNMKFPFIVSLICKEFSNYVFVGGVSEYIQGFKQKFFDIDLCILSKDLDKLENLLGCLFVNKSKVCFGGKENEKRFFVKLSKDILIDIFVVKQLPNHIVVNNIKVNTIDCLIETKKNALNGEFDNIHQKVKIEENLKRLLDIKSKMK